MSEINIPMSREEKKLYQLEQIQDCIEAHDGLVKTSDILNLGIDYRRLQQFQEEGQIFRVKSGYYTSKPSDYSEEQLITTMYPDGVLTMESALYYHGYLETRPYEWKIAISKNTSKSRFNPDYPAVCPYYSEDKVLELGTETTEIAGKKMKIYTIDRLICDVLKYQDKMEREDFKKAALTYINDEKKDIVALMEIAKERKVLKKVQSMIGVWL